MPVERRNAFYIHVHTQIMGTKTISLAEDAYERLKAEKRENESFSDVVRRLTTRVELTEFHGALSEGTADELETVVAAARERRNDRRGERVERIADELDDT